jgi:D-hexose-6-phosphate mutarotase
MKDNEHVIIGTGPGDIPVIEVDNPHGHAIISFLGANLIEWTPRDKKPVIWLSTDATFKNGRSIRGGIPICWPWFGAHSTEADFHPERPRSANSGPSSQLIRNMALCNIR